MNQKTKFSFLSIFVCVVLTGSAIGFLFITIDSKEAGIVLPILFLLFVTYFWLTEFRTRAHKIAVFKEKISKKEYFGLGKRKEYSYKEFDGYIIIQQPNKGSTSEYIFLIKGDRRIICLSEFYHVNYDRVKLEIDSKLKSLGQTEYNFKSEYREMFR
ncbi:hypothetical protein LB465_03260 [Salegentibacter sp. LM13S]|uniref:hypothetical protein n=1 Tax=Salegentibacter lacus TaxID=2873599 RepID=UPI001CCA3CF3|nr:hypothetical protein [Salegentibacter lacus]MBZ9629786.1 hypothetical protein [Salegentibacter lacus]